MENKNNNEAKVATIAERLRAALPNLANSKSARFYFPFWPRIDGREGATFPPFLIMMT